MVILGIFVWLERRELEAAWDDVRRGLWMAMVQKKLEATIHDYLGRRGSRRWSA